MIPFRQMSLNSHTLGNAYISIQCSSQIQHVSNQSNSKKLDELKERGNKYRIKISEYEDKKRKLDKQLFDQISCLPNLPSKDAPLGKNENNNKKTNIISDIIAAKGFLFLKLEILSSNMEK